MGIGNPLDLPGSRGGRVDGRALQMMELLLGGGGERERDVRDVRGDAA